MRVEPVERKTESLKTALKRGFSYSKVDVLLLSPFVALGLILEALFSGRGLILIAIKVGLVKV